MPNSYSASGDVMDEAYHNTNMLVQGNPALSIVFQRLVGMEDKVLGRPVISDRSLP